jgi:hypothetical protein
MRFYLDFISFSAEELDLNLNNGEALHIRKKDDPPAIVQNFWTAAEDVRLEQLVIDMGFKWAAISKKLGEGLHPRKQCRDRFLFYLKKDTMRNPWTEVEQMQLLKAQHRSGNKWVEFAKIIQTHSADAVRHYWRSYMRSLTENYLTITGKVKRDALVSNYNFGVFSWSHCNDKLTVFPFTHLFRPGLCEHATDGGGLPADNGIHPHPRPGEG